MISLESDSLRSRIQASAEQLMVQLKLVGVDCQGIALFDGEGNPSIPFQDASPALIDATTELVARVREERQFTLTRDGVKGYLTAFPLLAKDGATAHVFLFRLSAVSESTLQLVRLAIAWLHLPFIEAAAERGGDAMRVLDLQAHVFSQERARSGAQEWVNKLAQMFDAESVAGSRVTAVHYFRVDDASRAKPSWWVTSDAAWVERGATALHAASDAANRAAFELRELKLDGICAIPVIDQGDLVGVLVVEAEKLTDGALIFLRASASVVAPLLAHWHVAERGLLVHAVATARAGVRRLREPGHLTWKATAIALLLLSGFLLLLPFDDHATGKVVVEGRAQYLVTSPYEGFWAEVLVRPGDMVRRGQVLARLDTRDLVVEREKLQSERDLASGKLRQFFADGDSSGVQQSSAQLRQAEAELALVLSKIDRAEIRAPNDGMVISGDWKDQLGSPIETGKKMFEIAAGDGFKVVLQVQEEDIARVRIGQQGEIRVTGLPHQNFGFTVNRVTSVAAIEDHKNGFRVEAKLTNQDPGIRPGMQGIGKVVVGKSNLLSIWMRPVAVWLRMKLWSWWW